MRLVEMRSGAVAVALSLLLLAGCGKQPVPQPEPEPENPPGYVDAMTASVECQDGSLFVLLGWEPATGADTYILERNYEALAGIDPDALAPREALGELYRLKQILADER